MSYPMNFKRHALKTDCAALTNLDSDVMSGHGNTGLAFCTLVPFKDLRDETKAGCTADLTWRFLMRLTNLKLGQLQAKISPSCSLKQRKQSKFVKYDAIPQEIR